MRSRIVAIVACVVLVFVGVGAAVLYGMEGTELPHRYIQHEEARQLSDLSPEEQKAASSTSTDPSTFASHLPVVSIDTYGQEIPGEPVDSEGSSTSSGDAVSNETISESADGLSSAPQVGAEQIADDEASLKRLDISYTLAADGRKTIASSFNLYSNDGDQANRLSDAPVLETQAEIRYRGHSSRRFDKKSYAIRFTESDRETEKECDVLGMGADESWVLYGPSIDKSLLHTYLAMNVFGQMLPYTSDVRFCELFVNGTYQGVYVLMETVKYGDDRVALTASDSRSEETSYIVRRDWFDPDATSLQDEDYLGTILVMPGTDVFIQYPSESSITAEQTEWIMSDLNRRMKSLYSYDYDTLNYGYWSNLDVDSFVDYALVNEFSLNVDVGTYSTYFYKDARGKLCAGPLWDFNNAFDNYLEESVADVGFSVPVRPVFLMLFKDESFVEQCIDRYKELRQGVLSDDYLQSFIADSVSYLGPAIDRNWSVWGWTFDVSLLDGDNKLVPDERNPSTFEEAVADLSDFIKNRGNWLDDNIENLRQFSHESVNKRYNH